MAKRWRKQKAGTQKSKKPKKQRGGGGSAAGAAGTMGGFRRGLKAFTGSGGKKGAASKTDRVVNLLLWGGVLVAGAFFAYRQCG